MPLYEYQCDACHNRFEVIQKFSDPPIGACPSCGGAVRKLLSSPAIQFKGSGWYITDYARKSGANGGGKAGEKEKAGEADKAAAKTTAAGETGKSSAPSGGSSSSTGSDAS